MEADNKALEFRIQFARHNFDNLQSLIRSSDTKAGVMVTIMVFLAASALQVGKDVVPKLHSQPWLVVAVSAIFTVAAVGLVVAVLWSFGMVFRVMRPRGARFTTAQKGRELMWQDHVLLHENNEVYFSAVFEASPELILRNITDQIYELAHISREKMGAISKNRLVGLLGFTSWAILIGCGLFLERH